MLDCMGDRVVNGRGDETLGTFFVGVTVDALNFSVVSEITKDCK